MKHSIKRILFVMGSILSLAGLMSWSMLRIPGGGSWVVHAVAVTPEPAGSVGVNPGHRVEFRKTTGAFLTNVTNADALFAGGIPSAFSSFDNGVAVINYSDFATNPSPPQQQNFGNDRDIRSASPNGFGAGGQDDYAMHSAGYILIPQAGSWNFTVNSDDGFRLRIGATDAVVATFPTPKIPSNVTGVAEVPVAGLYRYDLVYYEHDGDSEVEFFANGPGQPNSFLVGDPGGSLRVFQDIQGPSPCTLTCAPNKTQSKDSNQCGAIVTYAAPSTTGTCGTVVCTPASGSFFPVGTTTVTCSSNTNPPATCSFTVTVTDTDTGPLTITCPGTITGVGSASCPLSSGNANFTVTTTGPCATVVCKNQNNQVVTPNQPFPAGTTSVTCTATTGAGATATCTFLVKLFSFCLQDETNPNNFVFVNAETGDYIFVCGGVTTATGRGVLTTKVCIGTIDDSKGDRRVHIEWDLTAFGNKGAGTANVQIGPNRTLCTVTEKNISNNTCTLP